MTPQQLREAIAYGCTTSEQAKRWLEIQVWTEDAERRNAEQVASWYNR